MGKIVWLMAAAAVVGLVGGGSFDPMTSSPEGLLRRATRGAPGFWSGMSEEDIFEKFFTPNVYLLRPGELEENQQHPAEDDATSLEPAEEEHDDDDDDDSDEVAGRGIASGAKFVLKQIGKVGLNLLKKGLKFLKSTFYKFGGKRLLKRAKKYLKEDAFTLEPLSCEGATCSSCAVFTLPFKIKQFKACAEMGVKREKNRNGHMMTNFTVDFSVVKKSLFNREFEVGDIANCFSFGSDPDGRAGLAALIGSVCVQGFEFSIETDKTGKFCLALVFKRWATGYRFCAQRLKRKPEKDEKDEKGDKNGGNTGNGKKPAKKDKYRSKVTDRKNRKWKVELKRISAGEQDSQIVSDEPLFKNEAKVRQQHSEMVLNEGVPA